MTVSFNENYFQLFEIEKSLFIDLNVLEEKYLELQKEFHPDKYVNASDQEKRISLQITSYINEAYKTLKNDYLKSIYLLKIEGYKLEDQNNTISDSAFLMHQMELREEFERIKIDENPKEHENFCAKIKELKNECLEKFRKNYEKKLYEDAAEQINKMKFYMSIENDFKKDIL